MLYQLFSYLTVQVYFLSAAADLKTIGHIYYTSPWAKVSYYTERNNDASMMSTLSESYAKPDPGRRRVASLCHESLQRQNLN